MSIFLLAHIVIGCFSIFAGLVGFVQTDFARRFSQKSYAPSSILTLLSGIGLTMAGGNLVRSCITGAILLASLYGLRVLSERRYAAANI